MTVKITHDIMRIGGNNNIHVEIEEITATKALDEFEKILKHIEGNSEESKERTQIERQYFRKRITKLGYELDEKSFEVAFAVYKDYLKTNNG